MNRTANPNFLVAASLCCAGFFAHAVAETPRIPFSGAYGGTSGAGSIVAWDRLGADNPAALGNPGLSASVAGYAPFGIEDLGVSELAFARDAKDWGASLSTRTLSQERTITEGSVTIQTSRRLPGYVVTGFALSTHLSSASPVFGAGLGARWRPVSFASLGAMLEQAPDASRMGGGFGIDFGTRIGEEAAWRVTVETLYGTDETFETRFGLLLRFHSLLGVCAGYAPGIQTASLGVRFGFGSWEGFSALRRHAALGSTSVQGLRWSRYPP